MSRSKQADGVTIATSLNCLTDIHEYQFVEAGKYPVIQWPGIEQFVLVLPQSSLNQLAHHEGLDSFNEEGIFRIRGNALQINEVKYYLWYSSDLASSCDEILYNN